MKFTKIAISALFLMYSSLSLANHGWVVTETDKKNNPVQLVNESEQGNQLTLTCDVNTKKLSLTYSSGITDYDFFIFRNFGEIDMSTPHGKMIIGTSTVTQANLYKNLMDANRAFVVTYYPVGSKHAWDEAVELNLEQLPDIHQDGEAFFITGDGDIETMLKGMSVNCPIDKPAKPIL